jgi:cation transport regulator
MPYDKIDELPEQVRYNLPRDAQRIFMDAFNSAWKQYNDSSKRRGFDSLEEVANKVAWSAVKKQYDKDPISGDWKKKELLT